MHCKGGRGAAGQQQQQQQQRDMDMTQPLANETVTGHLGVSVYLTNQKSVLFLQRRQQCGCCVNECERMIFPNKAKPKVCNL